MGRDEKRDEDAASDEQLARVVRALKELDRKTEIERFCARGQLILERCYGGRIERWRDQRSMKSDSIRRLAQLPQCPWGRTTLNNAVAVHELCERMPEVVKGSNLTASHVVQVLRLEPPDQRRFLMEAGEHAWSVRELHEVVVRFRRQHGETRGAPPASHVRVFESKVRRCVQGLEGLGEVLAEASPITLDDVESMSLQLGSIHEVLGGIESKLRELEADPVE